MVFFEVFGTELFLDAFLDAFLKFDFYWGRFHFDSCMIGEMRWFPVMVSGGLLSWDFIKHSRS